MLAFACVGAVAADISVEELKADDGRSVTILTVEGELEFGDEKRFVEKAIGLDDAFVLLDGPGGNLHAGIEIGKAIRLKSFRTLVPDGFHCVSACALAWLGGVPALMERGGAIGFHAAWKSGDGGRPDSVANALVGAYLTNLGLPPTAVAYVTEAQPDEMRYLTYEEAVAVGIPAQKFGETSAADVADGKPQVQPGRSSTAARTPPSGDLPADQTIPAEGQEWIQLFSRASFEESLALATAQQPLLPMPASIFRYDNGWYVVAMGPFRPGSATPEMERLVGAGLIPGDSLVTTGHRFVAEVWSQDQQPRSPTATPEQEAIAAVAEIFRLWSQPNLQAINALPEILSETVIYFGKPTSRDQVIREKATFAERWPDRQYTLDATTAQAACTPAGPCVVRGIVHWTAYSPARDTTSQGSASFRYALTSTSPIRVSAEESEVLSRSIVKGRVGPLANAGINDALRGHPERFRVTDIDPSDALKIRAGAGTGFPSLHQCRSAPPA